MQLASPEVQVVALGKECKWKHSAVMTEFNEYEIDVVIWSVDMYKCRINV